MPHPEQEHSLRIRLATALRELEEEKAMAGRLGDRAWAAEEERDALRTEVKRLRAILSDFVAAYLDYGKLARARDDARAALAGEGDRG